MYSVLYGGFENEKKRGKKNLTFHSGDLKPGVLNNFPALEVRVTRSNPDNFLREIGL